MPLGGAGFGGAEGDWQAVGIGEGLAEVTGGAWVADRRDIYRIESSRRTVTDLELLAFSLALDCDVVWLLWGNPQESLFFQVPDLAPSN